MCRCALLCLVLLGGSVDAHGAASGTEDKGIFSGLWGESAPAAPAGAAARSSFAESQDPSAFPAAAAARGPTVSTTIDQHSVTELLRALSAQPSQGSAASAQQPRDLSLQQQEQLASALATALQGQGSAGLQGSTTNTATTTVWGNTTDSSNTDTTTVATVAASGTGDKTTATHSELVDVLLRYIGGGNLATGQAGANGLAGGLDNAAVTIDPQLA